jgi:thiamine biosynthesis lipoprotein
MSNEQRVTSNESKNRNIGVAGAASLGRRSFGEGGSRDDHAGRHRFQVWLRSGLGPSFTRCSLLVARYFLLVVLILSGCDGRREHVITGRTMGTTYSLKVVTGYFGSIAGLQEKIDRRLEQINHSMSPYLKDSEISRFNRFQQIGEEFRISADFLAVMKAAAQIYELSDGAWDGTVNPLVDLWGFGRTGRGDQAPAAEKIAALLGDIGFEKIEIRDSGALIKRQASVSLDLSSIAKGFGVDQVAGVVREAGFTDFLVEIGGEVAAAGARPDGRPWRVGINRPKPAAGFDEVYKVVSLKNQALATSGDYRQFFVQDGRRYSHIIDPKTGYPVTHHVVSVSILADTCTRADGLATAVMVMGAEKGLALINRLAGVEGLIVVENPDGSLTDGASRGWHAYED